MKTWTHLALTAGLLTTLAAAQTQTSTQATGSASTRTEVKAGSANASAHTDTQVNAGAQAQSEKNGKKSGETHAAGSAHGSGSATADASGIALPEGSVLHSVLSRKVDARKSKPGDPIEAKTTQDIKQDGKVVVAKGSRLLGHITRSQARAKGESETSLGFVFDTLVTRDGQRVPIRGTLQAIAAPAASAMAASNDDLFASTSAAGSAAGRGALAAPVSPAAPAGGGLLGGTVSTVSNTTAGLGATAGGAVSTATQTTGALGADVTGAALNANGVLNTGSQGVVNLEGLRLAQASATGEGAAEGSVLTSAGRNINLSSGTQMLIRLESSASAQKPQPK
jgi:hypothetical protein